MSNENESAILGENRDPVFNVGLTYLLQIMDLMKKCAEACSENKPVKWYYNLSALQNHSTPRLLKEDLVACLACEKRCDEMMGLIQKKHLNPEYLRIELRKWFRTLNQAMQNAKILLQDRDDDDWQI